MGELRVRNWDRWQSYRRDRGQPPWIKVHRALMRDMNWVSLSDAERGQLVAIWMLAADKGGSIPDDAVVIQKLCYMEDPPNLQLLMEKGFIEHDAKVASTWRHDDANMTSRRRQHDAPEESRGETEEKREETDIDENDAVASVVSCWNNMASEHELPTIRSVTGKRRKAVLAQLKSADWRSGYAEAIAAISHSRFLTGKVPPRSGSPPWRANFDWFIRPDSVNKILEGQYDDGKQHRDGEYVANLSDLFDD